MFPLPINMLHFSDSVSPRLQRSTVIDWTLDKEKELYGISENSLLVVHLTFSSVPFTLASNNDIPVVNIENTTTAKYANHNSITN